MDSVKEADEVIVLDTGSTDKTVEMLKEEGATVYVEEIKPWRFDIARNKSLDLLPLDTDICVCIDLDEIIDKGWRAKLEEIWANNTNRLAYNYNWSFDEYGKPAVNFYIEKIHDRKNYIWYHPVHEVLKYIGYDQENKKMTDDFTVNHYPDNSKPRSQYLPLLELSVEEDPYDDRNMHYLGREYMYNDKNEEAIAIFHKHLKLKRAVWKPERAASMRFMARCYKKMQYIEEAALWFQKAIDECPDLREGYIELGILQYELKNYEKAIFLFNQALNITDKSKIYINENFSWDSTISDYLSICYYNLCQYKKAYFHIKEAIKLDKNNDRLKDNKKIIKQRLDEIENNKKSEI